MPMNQRRKIYKTMQGKQIDMDLLRQRNELTPAVGNARVNARGDELGPGGKIVKKKEDILKTYYNKNEVAQEQSSVTRKKAAAPVEKDLTDDWFEDDEGNFVKKGKK